jgi:hypothetical protein
MDERKDITPEEARTLIDAALAEEDAEHIWVPEKLEPTEYTDTEPTPLDEDVVAQIEKDIIVFDAEKHKQGIIKLYEDLGLTPPYPEYNI